MAHRARDLCAALARFSEYTLCTSRTAWLSQTHWLPERACVYQVACLGR